MKKTVVLCDMCGISMDDETEQMNEGTTIHCKRQIRTDEGIGYRHECEKIDMCQKCLGKYIRNLPIVIVGEEFLFDTRDDESFGR